MEGLSKKVKGLMDKDKDFREVKSERGLNGNGKNTIKIFKSKIKIELIYKCVYATCFIIYLG